MRRYNSRPRPAVGYTPAPQVCHMRGAVLRGLAAATAPLAMSSSMQAETPVRVAVVQMRVENDKTANLRHCRELVEKAADTGAQLVVLPEVWNSEYAVGAFAGNAEPVKLGKPEGASTELLGDLARRRGVWIVGGSIPERDGANIYNTAPVVDDLGTIVAKHRKVHLFDIDVPGKIRFFESETLAAGDEATVVPLPEDVAPGGHKLGVGICYDCRFAPLAITMRGKGATIIAYPGAFNTVTGPPHYHLLARARALDSQAFVLFASPARNPNSNYQAYGHSIICDPWGTPIATAKGHDEEIIVADLDLSRIAEVRASMRLWDQRRPDVYELGVKPPSEE